MCDADSSEHGQPGFSPGDGLFKVVHTGTGHTEGGFGFLDLLIDGAHIARKNAGVQLQRDCQLAQGLILNSIINASMSRSFCDCALPLSFGVGYGYASFFRLSAAIKNPHPISALIHSFSISHRKSPSLG
jgi:hypothetical protein